MHEVLQSPGWSGRWLGVLDDLPAPSELEKAGLGWVLEEFPWAHGRTIITTRSGEWVEEDEDSREVTEADRRMCDKCGQDAKVRQVPKSLLLLCGVSEASVAGAQAGVRDETGDAAERSHGDGA